MTAFALVCAGVALLCFGFLIGCWASDRINAGEVKYRRGESAELRDRVAELERSNADLWRRLKAAQLARHPERRWRG